MAEISFVVSEGEELEFSIGENEKPTQTKSVTPTEEAQTVLPDPGFLLDQVNVAAVPWVRPSGSVSISANGEVDVEQYATANVAVPQGVFPTGTLEISADGTYDVTNYASVAVDTTPPVGVLFSDWEDEYPTKAVVKGIPSLPSYYMAITAQPVPMMFSRLRSVVTDAAAIRSQAFERLPVTEAHFTAQTAVLYGYVLRSCSNLVRVVFDGNVSLAYSLMGEHSIEEIIVGGNVTKWENPFYTNNPVDNYNLSLADFSHSAFFALASVNYFPHASGCVIRVPQSLLASWQAATNWCDLTGVVWQGV